MTEAPSSEYPWHMTDYGHVTLLIMVQQRLDGRWSAPQEWGGIMRTRSRRCQRPSGDDCAKHPWAWTAYRKDRLITHGTTLEAVLPPSWRQRDLSYVRWWIETLAPAHDRQQAVNEAMREHSREQKA